MHYLVTSMADVPEPKWAWSDYSSCCTTGLRMFPPRFGYHRRAIHRETQRGWKGSRFKRSARKWPLGFSIGYRPIEAWRELGCIKKEENPMRYWKFGGKYLGQDFVSDWFCFVLPYNKLNFFFVRALRPKLWSLNTSLFYMSTIKNNILKIFERKYLLYKAWRKRIVI